MPFVRDWTPFHESQEHNKDIALRQQENQQRQTQQMLQLAMQGVGMGLQQYNAGKDREMRQQGMDEQSRQFDVGHAQQQGQFDAAQAQQSQKFMQDLKYKLDVRDQLNARRDALNKFSAERASGILGRPVSPETPSELTLPVVQGAQLTDDAVRTFQAKHAAEVQRWGESAGALAKSLPSLVQANVMQEEEAQFTAQYLQQNPQETPSVYAEIVTRTRKKFDEEHELMQDHQWSQNLSALATDPSNPMVLDDKERKENLYAAKMVENKIWNREQGKRYIATGSPFPASNGGNSSFERMMKALMEAGRLDANGAMDAVQNRFNSQSMPPNVKDAGAIGGAVSEAERLDGAVKSLEERAKATDNPEDAKAAKAMLPGARERAAKAKGAEAAAKTGSKIRPNAPTVQQTAPVPQAAVTTALQKFKAKHGRAPDKTNPDDVAEMRTLAGG